MTTLTITLDDDLERQVQQFAEESGLSLEAAATELLQRNADVRKLRSLRTLGRTYARQAGIQGEDEIFEAVREWRKENRGNDPQ